MQALTQVPFANSPVPEIPPPRMDPEIFEIGGHAVARGERLQLNVPVAKLYDHSEVNIPVEIIRGKKPGPTLFISAAIHGDELIGVAVCRRVLEDRRLKRLHGTLIVIPVVNVFGFNSLSRYLPDRRDLNRCFPGSPSGSLTSRLAHVFLNEIVKKSTHGIDLHTGAAHRYNLPQIRAETGDPATRELAEAFGLSVVLKSNIRDGSLRQAGLENRIPMLLFEGGEALRFDEKVIRSAYKGIFSVMQKIKMIESGTEQRRRRSSCFIAERSQWLRASKSGVITPLVQPGGRVQPSQPLAIISDTYGREVERIFSQREGIVIGALMLPVVHEGDALFHIAYFDNAEKVEEELLDAEEFLN